jgi:hypothetical protein
MVLDIRGHSTVRPYVPVLARVHAIRDKGSEAMSDYDTVCCPKCRGGCYEDMDGFGFIHCTDCGYCTHPAADQNALSGKWYCGVCSSELPTRGDSNVD